MIMGVGYLKKMLHPALAAAIASSRDLLHHLSQRRSRLRLQHHRLKVFFYKIAVIFFGLFLIGVLHTEWLSLPLTSGWRGADIVFGPIGLAVLWFVLVCYSLGLIATFFGQKLGLVLLIVPPTVLFCWPFLSVIEPTGIFPLYFEEARNRIIIERVFRLQNQLNVNIQPTYTAIFDTNSLWSQIKSIFSSLSLSWYLFCILGFVFPAVINQFSEKRGALIAPYLCFPFIFAIVLYRLSSNDHYQFPANTTGPDIFADVIEHCSKRLSRNDDIAHSDFFVTRCAEAYSALHSWSDPVAAVPKIGKLMGGRGFLSLNPRNYEQLEISLLPLLHIDTADPLSRAFNTFARRHHLLLIKLKALNALQERDFQRATANINRISDNARGPAAWIMLGYALAQQGQTEAAVNAFNRAIVMLNDKTVVASVYCAIGDSLVNAGQLAEARTYYQTCKEKDPEQNYWAVSGLGGI